MLTREYPPDVYGGAGVRRSSTSPGIWSRATPRASPGTWRAP